MFVPDYQGEAICLKDKFCNFYYFTKMEANYLKIS